MSKEFYKHCKCGFKCPGGVVDAITSGEPLTLSAKVVLANNGGGIVCGSGYSEVVGVYLLKAYGTGYGTSALFNSNANNATPQSDWLLICNMFYDPERYIWEGCTSSPPGESSYGYQFCYRLLPKFALLPDFPFGHHVGFNPCLEYFVKSGSSIITPFFHPDAYTYYDTCTAWGNTYSGNITAYQDVLPKFLFKLPYTYTVDTGAGFTTAAGNVVSGTYVVTEGGFNSETGASIYTELDDPCPVYHGMSYITSNWVSDSFIDDTCGFNWRHRDFVYINDLGEHCAEDGEFVAIGVQPSATPFTCARASFSFRRIVPSGEFAGVAQSFVVQYAGEPFDAYGTNTLYITGPDGPGAECPSDLVNADSPDSITVTFQGF